VVTRVVVKVVATMGKWKVMDDTCEECRPGCEENKPPFVMYTRVGIWGGSEESPIEESVCWKCSCVYGTLEDLKW
jgi:hypothetical protein